MRLAKWLPMTAVALLIGGSSLAFAQTNVDFAVDMRVHIATGTFDPATQGVSAVGSHNGWGAADLAANALADDDGDGIYTATIGVGEGEHMYKYVATQDGGIAAWESSPDRPLSVGADPVAVDTTEWAQGINFRVDMAVDDVPASFDPAIHYVAAVGTFNGWGGADSSASALSDEDGDNVWTGRHPVAAGLADANGVKFKFVTRNKSDQSVAEWEGHPDRDLAPSGVMLDPAETGIIPWNGDIGTSVDVNVTFNCDMRVHIAFGTFDPAAEGISQVGSHNGWENADLAASALSDEDGDGIYSGTFVIESGENTFKYVVTEGGALAHWESSDDRPLSLDGMMTDVELDTSEWSQGVNFSVDMTDPLNDGLYNPEVHYIAAVGTFNGWGGATRESSELIDENDDNVYDGILPVAAGLADANGVKFKYVIRNEDDSVAEWESLPDRDPAMLGFGIDPANLATVKWDMNPGEAVDATLLFQVDVTPLRDLGLFDETDGDSLVVYGGFNGWNGAELDQSLMRQSLTDAAIFELALPVTDVPGVDLEYKYFIKFNQSSDRFTDNPPPSGWEEPGSTGGGNRIYEFTSDAQQVVGVQTFNDIFTVVPDTATYWMHFTADMRCALRDPTFGDVATDTLFMDSADPFWHFFNGTLGDDGESRPMFPFEDEDGDSVYTLSIQVTGPQQNWMQYKLNWAGIEEAGPGFSSGRRRVRFARSTGVDGEGNPTFDAEYQMGLDYWNTDIAQPLVVEDEAGEPIDDAAPCMVTPVSVRFVDGAIPSTFELMQNYPNPFNPSTTVRYQLAKSAPVKLVIYNALGQQVATVVNEVQQAGSYEVVLDFNTELNGPAASGVYYFQLQAGDNFVSTKKMVLMK